MQRLGVYNPAEVAVIFAGAPLSGFADGTFVTVERNEDSYTLQVGTDGEQCRSKSNNKSGRITVTLMQSSQSNAILSAFHALDELSPNGDAIAPSLVKDNQGTSLYAAEKSWIVKPASAEHGRESGSREWIIETGHLNVLVGGN